MGDYVCDTCGLDCRTPLALGKHKVKCASDVLQSNTAFVAKCVNESDFKDYKPRRVWQIKGSKPEFSDRHDKTGDKCPVCKDTWVFFWKKDGDTWVCLACGCHFTPKDRLKVVNDARLKN